ncbi:hypothetical protein [Jannaschia seohaensis]|uniref:Uncharacterized protein n=1 Tax=Jannaschia seohaensis TaxID=475081 RepID=A0A2Y9BY25_9RHOB|nr:hypothetical protein [Jannaschia seohaensis]PWJ21342.1 hypothetical protein BCF38_102594 [Jannaschia seohaensis]SSA41882.1 hypothetical protein SAMN05421539_102594 [Jannaschia seohaensis]
MTHPEIDIVTIESRARALRSAHFLRLIGKLVGLLRPGYRTARV